jgi:hypothetical protein
VSTLRKIVDEKDARACLVAVARSGLTLRAWAQRQGVDGRSLHAWQVNLSGRSALARPVPAKLVELVPVSTAVSTRRYIVRVGDASVEVGDDFDVATLQRILEVLRAC